jgi:hypothetical protein
MPTHKKNTLLKNAQANAESIFFKRVFFSATQRKIFATPLFLIQLFFQRTGFVRNRTDIASNVNRFVESVCGHEQLCFVGTAPHAANIRLKEILKRRALFGNQTVVLLTSSGALTNSGASNPFFLKLL